MTETDLPFEAPQQPAENLSEKPRTAVVSFAGFASGGSNTAQYEALLNREFGAENVTAFPSITTKFAFEKSGLSGKTYRSNEYYATLAKEVIEKFSGHDAFLIHCQSGGGIEGLEFARALLGNDAFKAKKISFLFTGVPGFAEQEAGKVRRVFEFLGRFAEMGSKRAENQHFDLYPPPEEYYAYQQIKQPAWKVASEKTETVYHDNPETREERRKKFRDHYMSFLSPVEKAIITQKLLSLNESIRDTIQRNDRKTEKELKKLMAQRAKLVYGIGGDRYYKDVANKPEYKDIPNPGFDGTTVGAMYLVRIFSSVAEGMEKKLGKVLKLAKEKGVEADFAIGLLEKDTIVRNTDVPHMEKRFNEAGLLDNFVSWLTIEGLSHESVDNSAQGVLQAILNLYRKINFHIASFLPNTSHTS